MDNVQDMTDAELVQLTLEDANYLGYLIDRYEKPLDRYLFSISNASAEDRQDLLQEIFIAVYQNLASYKQSMKFSSWLYRIAHNKSISWWRKHKKESLDVSIDEHADFISSVFNENNVEDDINQQFEQDAINYAFSTIKDEYRELLVLKFIENKGYKEIADITSSTTGTVGTRIKRAKKQFIIKYNEYEQT